MTNKEIMDIAMQQSAYDTNAKVSDFLQDTNVFVKSGVGPLARKYYKEPIACNFVSYGSNVVASVKDEFKEIVETYLSMTIMTCWLVVHQMMNLTVIR